MQFRSALGRDVRTLSGFRDVPYSGGTTCIRQTRGDFLNDYAEDRILLDRDAGRSDGVVRYNSIEDNIADTL